ncbi:MAG TPA: hemerythrin domain-containing protein [Gammaproteobacteria bacterium]|nr:hemerythrin domain-containing protein [Gammaproteobacteria bacterium]
MSACRDTVTGFFQDDHRRLDDVFERYRRERMVPDGEPLAAFGQFADGLRRHIAWEEDHLFPLCEERTGMALAGPTEVMRREHREIERLLDGLAESLGRGIRAGLDEAEDRLADMLGRHNVKEEQVLYPGIDGLLDGEECRRLFARIRGE